MSERLQIVPIGRETACEFITLWHRHHQPPQGYRFALGVSIGGMLVGVATAGRPVARAFDDGLTLEVTRLATDGTPHACSALYGACWRTAKAMGYRRAVTYTQAGESGASLRAAGWVNAATRAARAGWNSPSRRRDNARYGSVGRLLWLVESSREAVLPVQISRPAAAAPDLTLFDLAAS